LAAIKGEKTLAELAQQHDVTLLAKSVCGLEADQS
jgi:hypothetical protein